MAKPSVQPGSDPANPRRAASANPYDQFFAALVAPLPEGVETVKSRAFMKELAKDGAHRWNMAKIKFDAMEYYRNAAYCLRIRAETLYPDTVPDRDRICDETWDGMVRACHELMMMPAPNVRALRWKQDTRKMNGGSPEWEVAIAADCLRLGKDA